MSKNKSAIKKENVKRLSKDIVPMIQIYQETEEKGGMPIRILRGNFNRISSRMLRQAIVYDLEGKGGNKLYRTRVETEKGVEAAVSTEEPNEMIKEEIKNLGEEYDGDNWDRIYRFRIDERVSAPETKYNYEVFSGLPELIMRHARRHDEDLEQWNENRITGDESGVFSWSLKGVDPESESDEREIRYNIHRTDGRVELETELVLKKRNNCIWPVDPLEADKYMKAVFGSEDDPKRRVLFQRAGRGEELAEYAADLIRDDDIDYHEEDWKKNFDRYRDFLIYGEQPEDYFDKPKEKRGVALPTDPFLKELDGYVDTMKKGRKPGKEVSETKRGLHKDTKTATKKYKEPINEFLGYVEDAVYGRLKTGKDE